MVATPGTIPALTPYQPGALTITGQEAVEIVSSLTATSAVSGSMLIVDLVGKAPSALPAANPNQNDLVTFFQNASGLPRSCTIANLGIPSGNIPTGGTANQILAKNSATNFDASWLNITSFIGVDGVTLSTSGSATSIVIAVATISSTQLGPFAVQAGNIATAAVGGTTIANNAVGNAQFRQSAAQSIVGNASTTGVANVADIAATATGQVLQMVATGIVFAPVSAGILPGPFQTGTLTAFGVVYGNGTAALAATNAGTSGLALVGTGTTSAPNFGVAAIIGGGTGTNTLTAHGVLLGNGTSALGVTSTQTAGQLLIGQGTTSDPLWKTATADLTIATTGTVTVTGLQGRALSSAAPATAQSLAWNGVTWAPATTFVTAGWGLTASNGTVSISTTAPPYGLDAPINIAMTASVGTGVLNITFLNNAGGVPNATSPILVGFQNTNATNAVPLWASISTALSMSTFTTGATLGAASSSAPFRIWVTLFYQNATSVMPALINCSQSSGNVFSLLDSQPQTTVAIGSTATSAGVFYSPNGTTANNAPFRIVGFVDYAGGLATAGTYSTAPTALKLFSAGGKKPGDTVQTIAFQPSSINTVAFTTVLTTTNLSASITPSSAINLVNYVANISTKTNTNAGGNISGQLYRAGNPIGALAGSFPSNSTTGRGQFITMGVDFPATTVLTNYVLECTAAVGTGQIPNTNTDSGVLLLTEIMG